MVGDDERRGRRGGVDGEPLARLGEGVEALVRRVLAEQRRDPVASVESLQQLAIFGDAAQLHIHPTAKVNDALFNLSSGEVTVGADSFFGQCHWILDGHSDRAAHQGRDRWPDVESGRYSPSPARHRRTGLSGRVCPRRESGCWDVAQLSESG